MQKEYIIAIRAYKKGYNICLKSRLKIKQNSGYDFKVYYENRTIE